MFAEVGDEFTVLLHTKQAERLRSALSQAWLLATRLANTPMLRSDQPERSVDVDLTPHLLETPGDGLDAAETLRNALIALRTKTTDIASDGFEISPLWLERLDSLERHYHERVVAELADAGKWLFWR